MQFLQKCRWIDFSLNLVVAVAYLILAKIGLFFAITSGNVTIFWPAGGLALAILLLAGLKFLPGIFAGAFAAGLMVKDSVLISAFIALGNVMESFVAYWLLTHRFNFHRDLTTREDFFKLTLIAGTFASVISALIGVTTLSVWGSIQTSLYGPMALRWWMADVLGIAFMTPLILIWSDWQQQATSKPKTLEVAALIVLAFLTGQAIFFDWFEGFTAVSPSIAWIIPLIIWSGLRIGRHSTAVLQLMIFTQALWSASHGIGDYADAMEKSGLVNFWVFGMVIAVGGMALAVITTENRNIQNEWHRLHQSIKSSLNEVYLFHADTLRFFFVNQGAINNLGYSMEELMLMTPIDLKPYFTEQSFRARISPLLRHETSSLTFETMHKRKDGSLYPIEVHLQLNNDLHDHYFQSIILDCTERIAAETALRTSEERLRLALAAAKQGWFDLNVQTGQVSVSDEYPQLLGYDPAEFHSNLQEWQDNLHPDDHDIVMVAFSECLTNGGPVSMAYRRRTKDGGWIWLNSIGEITEWGPQHQPLRMIGIHTDITERKQAEELLYHRNEYLKAIFDTEPECVIVIARNGHLNDINAAGLKMLEVDSLEEAQALRLVEFIDPDYRDPFIDLHADVCGGNSGVLEFLIKGKKGTLRWLETHAAPLRDKNGNVISLLGVARDITERKRNETALTRQAHTDYLTGVSNRGHFMELAELELNRAVRYGSQLSICMMDIDFFKKVNDSHGHKAGDAVLKMLAEVCRQTLREIDIIGRVGGEEFAILLPETGKEKATEVAERLREALANAKVSLESGGMPLQFTVSIGLTSHASENDSVDALLHLADKALYEAKASGRNKVCIA